MPVPLFMSKGPPWRAVASAKAADLSLSTLRRSSGSMLSAVEASKGLLLSLLLTPYSLLLTPYSLLLTPYSSLLTPHSSLLTPHSSLLTPHSSLLTPHLLLLTPCSPEASPFSLLFTLTAASNALSFPWQIQTHAMYP
jgi:hypothetical protein